MAKSNENLTEPKVTTLVKQLKTHADDFQRILNKLNEFGNQFPGAELGTFEYKHLMNINGSETTLSKAKNHFNSTFNYKRDDEELNKDELIQSFAVFKSTVEQYVIDSEEKFKTIKDDFFKQKAGIWHEQVKPILKGLLGVVIAIAGTLLTFGIATYVVASNKKSRDAYVNSFFKSDSKKWEQYAFKQKMCHQGITEVLKETDDTIKNDNSLKK